MLSDKNGVEVVVLWNDVNLPS